MILLVIISIAVLVSTVAYFVVENGRRADAKLKAALDSSTKIKEADSTK